MHTGEDAWQQSCLYPESFDRKVLPKVAQGSKTGGDECLLLSVSGENFHKIWLYMIFSLQVHAHMKAPIYVYYKLDKFYQNHRR